MKNKLRKANKKGGAKRLYDTGAPIDAFFHGDMSKKDLKEHINEVEENINRLDKEISVAQNDKKIEQTGLNNRRAKYEAVQLQNSAKYSEINTKWYIFILNGIASFFKYLFSAVGSLLHILIFQVLAGLLSLIFSIIKNIFNNYVFVGFILFCISVILILQFVFGYVVPLPEFVSKTPKKDNITNTEVLAEKKIDYQIDFIEKIKEFILGIPNIGTNAMINIRRMYQKLAKFFGNNNAMDLYIVDRDEFTYGRWDNVYNMELGRMVSNFQNINQNDDNIYSIIKPAPIEMHLGDINNLDIDKLPPSLQKDVKNNKETLKFQWNIDNSGIGYKLSCVPTDKNNQQINDIFEEAPNNECNIVKQKYINEMVKDTNKPQYYDIPARRGNKSLWLDLLME